MPDVKVTLDVVDGEGTLSAQEATSDALGEVHVRWTLGPRTGVQHLRASAPPVETMVTATARPQFLATVLYKRLMLLDPENGGMRTIFTQFVARNPVWSPDGRRIAFIGRPDNSIHDRVYVMKGLTLMGAPRPEPSATGVASVVEQGLTLAARSRRCWSCSGAAARACRCGSRAPPGRSGARDGESSGRRGRGRASPGAIPWRRRGA